MFNHRDHRVAQIQEFVGEICRLAPGSYGLLHVWDDESASLPNGFETVVVRRGTTQTALDGLLSPCHPVIEDW